MISVFKFNQSLPGIKSLSPESKSHIKTLIAQYRYAERNHCGVQNIYNRTLKQQLQALVEREEFGQIRDSLKVERAEQRIRRIHSWQVNQLVTLFKDETWARINPRLQMLRQSIDTYSCFTSQTLFMQLTQYLPAIENWVFKAEQELKQSKQRNQAAFKEYRRYLKAMRAEIEHEKELLTHTLFNRLCFSASAVNHTHDDILYYVTQKLREAGFVSSLPEAQRTGLKANYLQQFYSHIYKHGTKEQRNMLARFSWYVPGREYAYVARGAGLLLVPASLIHTLPVTRKLRWGNDKLVKAAICIAPLIHKLLNNPGLDVFKTTQNFDSTFKLITEKLTELEQQKNKGLFRYFYRHSNAKLEQWQAFLRSKQEYLLETQISKLEAIADEFKEDLSKLPNSRELNNAIHQIKQYPLTPTLKQRFSAAVNQLKAVDECRVYLDAIIEGEPPTGGRLNRLYHYHAFVRVAHECKPTWYDETLKDALSATLQRLFKRFNEHQAKADSPHEEAISTKLYRDITILKKLGAEPHQRMLKSYLHAYVYQYVRQLNEENVTKAALCHQEALILSLTEKDGSVNDTTIFEKVMQLRKLRKSSDTQQIIDETKEQLEAYLTGGLSPIATPSRTC